MQAIGIEDPDFNKAVWIVIQRLYWDTAMLYCAKNGLITALSKYIAYDTMLNFGDLEKFSDLHKGNSTEAEFLISFLNIKQDVIEKDPSLGDSTNNRVDMQKKLLKQGKFNLTSPMKLTCYGDSFTL